MKRATACAWVAAAGALLISTAAARADDATEQMFTLAATRDGATYAVARDGVAAQGKAALEMLKQEGKSNDWRRRALAEALILRITAPDKIAIWTRLWWAGHKLTFRDDGTVLVKFDPAEVAWQAKQGRKLPPLDTVILDRSIVPFVVDTLRERGSRQMWLVGAFEMLAHFADPRATEILVSLGAKAYRKDSMAVAARAALLKIGKPAVPALCRIAAEVSDDWHVARRQALATEALGQVGDKDALPVLIDALGKLKWPDAIIANCEAIAKLGGPDAPSVLFDELLAAARAWPGRSVRINTSPIPYANYYNPIRAAFISLGKRRLPVLAEHLAKGRPLLPRAIATGLQAELTHGKDADRVATARAIELTVALHDEAGALALIRCKQDPMAIEAITFFLTADKTRRERNDQRIARVVTALAEARHPRAVELCGTMLDKWPTDHVFTIVEALLICEDPKGAALLRKIIARHGTKSEFATDGEKGYKASAALARAILPALEGQPGHLVKLLESASAPVRLAAARQLARKGDLRAIDVLLAGALATKGSSHATLREAIVAMGKPAIAVLHARGAKSDDWREKLFCEATALRMTNPKLAAALHEAGLVRDHGFMSHIGPTVGTFRGAGQRVARAVGPEAIPLLEAAFLWQGDSVRAGIAVFALEQFKKARSIGVLASDFNGPGWVRGGNLVAVALQAFGPEGIEAAKKVPLADPDKERFSRRVSRHTAATSALVAAKDDEGVEGVLAGLKLAMDDKVSSGHAQRYLILAAAYDDPRLIDPTLKVFDKFGASVRREAMNALAKHNDERIVPACLKAMSYSYVCDEALRALARVKSKQLVPFLAGQLGKHKDESVRLGIARDVTRTLAQSGQAYLWPDQPKPTAKEHAAHVEQALDALVARLGDPSQAVQIAAADALARYAHKGSLKKYAPPLLAWIKAHKLAWIKAHRISRDHVMDYLAWSKDPGAGPVLLACYRVDPQRLYRVGICLGKLGYKEAISDVVAALDRRVSRKGRLDWTPEIAILASYGRPGWDELWKAFKRHQNVIFRAEAATELCRRRSHEGVFDEASKLFDQLVDDGASMVLSDTDKKRYRSLADELAGGLISADWKRAYPIVARAMIGTKDATSQARLTWRLTMLRARHPELARMSLDPAR